MADTAAKIFKAAEDLFGEKGYDAVSVNDIARRAGVGKALIFYHYGSKADLFDVVIERYYRAHTAAFAEALAIGGDFREGLRRLIDAYFDFIDGHRLFPRIVQHEVARGGGRLAPIRKNLSQLLSWTAHALEGALPKEGPLAAKQFVLSFSGMVINYFTYAPILGPFWGEDPMSAPARAERRAHLHWMVDTLLDKLLLERR